MLVPSVHHGKDTTHKTLETMCNAREWPQQCWKSCANGSNIVALRFSDHGTNERLGVVGSEVWSVSNFAQQLQTTRKNMQQGVRWTQTCSILQCWELLNKNVASVRTGLCTLDFFYNNKKMLRKATVLVGLWCACSAVLRAKRVRVWRRIWQRSLCLPFRLRVCIQWYLDITSFSLNRGSPVLHLRNGLSGWLTTVAVFFNSPFQTHHLPWETTIIEPLLYSLGTQRTNKDQQQNNLIDFLL